MKTSILTLRALALYTTSLSMTHHSSMELQSDLITHSWSMSVCSRTHWACPSSCGARLCITLLGCIIRLLLMLWMGLLLIKLYLAALLTCPPCEPGDLRSGYMPTLSLSWTHVHTRAVGLVLTRNRVRIAFISPLLRLSQWNVMSTLVWLLSSRGRSY